MPGPSTDPCPAWECGIKLRGSYVSMILQPSLIFNRLSVTLRAKWVRPFLLPWVDSNLWVRPGLPSLACHQQKEQTEKYVSVDRGSAYRAYTYWLSPTDPGVLSLAHARRNPHQRCQVWHQWWLQIFDPINLRSWRHSVSPFFCHSPDGSPFLIWYGSDGLGFWRILILRRRLARYGRGVCHALHCDVWWPGLLFCILVCDVHQRWCHTCRSFSGGWLG